MLVPRPDEHVPEDDRTAHTGARLTTTWPVGQIADYAIDGVPGEPPLAIREFPDRWEVFLETAQTPDIDLENSARQLGKMPYVAAMGAAMLGGSVGASVTNKRSGMLLGAGLGLIVAALLVAALDEPDDDAPLIPDAVEKHLDRVVDTLNARFGKRWVSLGISTLEAALIGVLPPQAVAFVKAVHQAETAGTRLGLTGRQKKHRAFEFARVNGLA